MKKHIAVLIVLSLFWCCAHANPLTANALSVVGDDDFPPFSYRKPDGTLHGIDIEVITELQNHLGIELSIELVPWKRLLIMTKQGFVFGSFSLFKTPEEYKKY